MSVVPDADDNDKVIYWVCVNNSLLGIKTIGAQKTQRTIEEASKSEARYLLIPQVQMAALSERSSNALLTSRLANAGSLPSLTEKGLSHPTLGGQRTALFRTIQRRQGNAFVQREVVQGHLSAAILNHAVKQAQSDQSSGWPLDSSVQADMEAGFRHNFSSVRLQTDSRAADLARDIHAQAFTRGQDIYSGAGRYRQDIKEGQRLLAHELTHVVQQGTQIIPLDQPPQMSEPTDSSEQVAKFASQAVVFGQRVPQIPSAVLPLQVQRQVEGNPQLTTNPGQQPGQQQQEPVRNVATEQKQTQETLGQQATASDELSAIFGFFTPQTFAQLLLLSRLSISQLRRDLEDVLDNPELRAEAEEWILGLESSLPFMQRRATEPLDQFWTGQAVLWGKEFHRLQAEIKASKRRKDERVIEARLARSQEKIAEAEARIEEERLKLNEEIRMAFHEGDESTLAKIIDISGTVLDIGLSLHELTNMMREALVKLPEEEISLEVPFTQWLTRVNKFLAAVNLLYSVTHLDAPTELGASEKGIEAVTGGFTSLITLFGLPAHMALYADLYLVPLTRIVLERVDTLVTRHLQELNIVAVQTGFSVEMSTYPGGWPMFNFMVQVKRAHSPEDIPAIPKEVEKYFLDQRKLLQAGTLKFTGEGESEQPPIHSELPTTGWWFWRELDAGKIKDWIFAHRDELWILFFGDMPVPELGINYRAQ